MITNFEKYEIRSEREVKNDHIDFDRHLKEQQEVI